MQRNSKTRKPVRKHGRGKTPETNVIDEAVGSRVRGLRQMRGMGQASLAAALGLTFQQVQKYEAGTNRISASRLVQISRILGAPVEYFFEGVEQGRGPNFPEGTGEVVELWSGLNAEKRRNLLAMMRSLRD